jgi:hypothetical protein
VLAALFVGELFFQSHLVDQVWLVISSVIILALIKGLSGAGRENGDNRDEMSFSLAVAPGVRFVWDSAGCHNRWR